MSFKPHLIVLPVLSCILKVLSFIWIQIYRALCIHYLRKAHLEVNRIYSRPFITILWALFYWLIWRRWWSSLDILYFRKSILNYFYTWLRLILYVSCPKFNSFSFWKFFHIWADWWEARSSFSYCLTKLPQKFKGSSHLSLMSMLLSFYRTLSL